MAKIEMDISEYEIMKEKQKLLEDSLNKERELQKQVEQLTKDKIKALEDAKMKVVKITKSEVTEHLLRKRVDETYVFRELLHVLGIDYRGLRYKPDFIHIDHLRNTFFEKVKSFSNPVEEITICGLDDIKVEIRDELKSKMDDDIKRKIEDAENVLSKNDKLLKENKTLTTDNDLFIEKNKKLTERCDELAKKLTEIENGNEILMNIKDLLKNGYGFWDRSKILNSIIKQLQVPTVRRALW